MKNCEQEYIKYGPITVQPACASPQPESICFYVNSHSLILRGIESVQEYLCAMQ